MQCAASSCVGILVFSAYITSVNMTVMCLHKLPVLCYCMWGFFLLLFPLSVPLSSQAAEAPPPAPPPAMSDKNGHPLSVDQH